MRLFPASILTPVFGLFIFSFTLILIWAIYCIEDKRNELVQEVLERETYLIEKMAGLPRFE